MTATPPEEIAASIVTVAQLRLGVLMVVDHDRAYDAVAGLAIIRLKQGFRSEFSQLGTSRSPGDTLLFDSDERRRS